MKTIHKCILVSAILGLCTFGACKKQDPPAANDAQPPVTSTKALAENTPPSAAEVQTPDNSPQLPIDEYIPANALATFVSSPYMSFEENPFMAIAKQKHQYPGNSTLNQIAFYILPEYSCFIVNMNSAEQVRNEIESESKKENVINTRTIGSADQQWKILRLAINGKDQPPVFRAYHSAGKTLFMVITANPDEKQLNAILEKPSTPHHFSAELRQHKDVAMMGDVDIQAMLSQPLALSSFGLSTQSFEDFIKEQNITAAFIQNFPSIRFISHSSDRGISMKFHLNLSDPSIIAKLSSWLIPGPVFSGKSPMLTVRLNIDLSSFFTTIHGIIQNVDITTLPTMMQPLFEKARLWTSLDEYKDFVPKLLKHYGAITYQLFDNNGDKSMIFDIEGKTLTQKLTDVADPSAPWYTDPTMLHLATLDPTPLDYFNDVFKRIAYHILNLGVYQQPGPNQFGNVMFMSHSRPKTYQFHGGANDNRIIFGVPEDEIKRIYDSNPQMTSSQDLIFLEIADKSIIQNHHYFRQLKRTPSRVSIGVGPDDSGLRFQMDWTY